MFEVIHHFSQLSSCVGSNSCGVGTATSGVTFGATNIDTMTAKGWLADSNSTVTMAMTGSDQGMFNSYAGIDSYWSDTTAMVCALSRSALQTCVVCARPNMCPFCPQFCC
jgi:hypothetical protein